MQFKIINLIADLAKETNIRVNIVANEYDVTFLVGKIGRWRRVGEGVFETATNHAGCIVSVDNLARAVEKEVSVVIYIQALRDGSKVSGKLQW